MISDDLQCCFIHIPKTAGTSIGKLLLDDINASNKLLKNVILRSGDPYYFFSGTEVSFLFECFVGFSVAAPPFSGIVLFVA